MQVPPAGHIYRSRARRTHADHTLKCCFGRIREVVAIARHDIVEPREHSQAVAHARGLRLVREEGVGNFGRASCCVATLRNRSL
eukprot:4178677-Alexandrium_andersonii.AAC.1